MNLLHGLVSDSNEVYNGVIWALLYCPFTPFFVLFGDVLSRGDDTSKKLSLEAMRCLPDFMEKMASRNPQAVKLHKISNSLVQQAESAMRNRSEGTRITNLEDAKSTALDTQPQQPKVPTAEFGRHNSQMFDMFDSHAFMHFFNSPLMPDQSTEGTIATFWTPDSTSSEFEVEGSNAFSSGLPAQDVDLSNIFMQSDFDWFAWDSNVFGIDDTWNPF